VLQETLTEPFNDRMNCHLGVWLGLDAQARYGHQPEFAEVELLHNSIHDRAAQILSLCSSGQRSTARLQLQEFYLARNQLIAKLMSLVDHR